jgi:hypothetical protein
MPFKQEKKSEEVDVPLSKGALFDLFYGKKQVTRSGGGTVKTKMTRLLVSDSNLVKMESKIKKSENSKFFMKYFTKLKDRKAGIAPPPRPKN